MAKNNKGRERELWFLDDRDIMGELKFLTMSHYHVPTNIYSIKTKTSDKTKGVEMIKMIENMFNLTRLDIEEIRKELVKKDKEMFSAQPDLEKLKGTKRINETSPIVWSRDDKGNIVSRFRVLKDWKE